MKKLLVVVDMQNDFIDGSLGSVQAQAIVENVKKKAEAYAKRGESIIFTRDTHHENYLETQEGSYLSVEHCIINTKGWEITDQLDTVDAAIIDKPSFGSPELAEYIKEALKPDEIELVGLCTDICVISNALILKAFLPEVKVSVDASCCAGVTLEGHWNAVKAMKMCQVNIING